MAQSIDDTESMAQGARHREHGRESVAQYGTRRCMKDTSRWEEGALQGTSPAPRAWHSTATVPEDDGTQDTSQMKGKHLHGGVFVLLALLLGQLVLLFVLWLLLLHLHRPPTHRATCTAPQTRATRKILDHKENRATCKVAAVLCRPCTAKQRCDLFRDHPQAALRFGALTTDAHDHISSL